LGFFYSSFQGQAAQEYICAMPCRKILVAFLFLFDIQFLSAQIAEAFEERNVFGFTIRWTAKASQDKNYLVMQILQSDKVVIADSVVTNKARCTGFAFPAVQPFSDYFIFSKHEKENGKTYILNAKGEYTVIPGGTFWAAPKHQLLFMLAERDLTNLLIYSLPDKKVLMEKFNCDEFDGWYYSHGKYMGTVVKECGLEPEKEREFIWLLNQEEVELYNPADNSLNETTTNSRAIKKAKKLVRFAACN
jgi:hypothetical protein